MGWGYYWFFNIFKYYYSILMDVLFFIGWDFSVIKKNCDVSFLLEMYSIYLF